MANLSWSLLYGSHTSSVVEAANLSALGHLSAPGAPVHTRALVRGEHSHTWGLVRGEHSPHFGNPAASGEPDATPGELVRRGTVGTLSQPGGALDHHPNVTAVLLLDLQLGQASGHVTQRGLLLLLLTRADT